MRTPLRRATTLTTGALVAALVAVTPVTVPAPASAAVTGTTSSSDVVLYPQCQNHPIDYSVDAQGTSFWNLEIQVEGPTGLQSEGDVVTSTASPARGTVGGTVFCGGEAPGTYTVKASGIYEYLPGVRIPYDLPDSTFEVRRAHTHTALAIRRARHHNVKLVSTVSDERAGGYGLTEGAEVSVQRLVDGTWRKVKGSSERSFHGHTVRVVRAVRGATYRAVTVGRGNYDGSTSGPVTIRRR